MSTPDPTAAVATAPPPPKLQTCPQCGTLTDPRLPCVTCGAKPKLLSALGARLAALATGTLETGDKRPPILVALIAIGAASVALGFELGRHALQAVLDDKGLATIGPDGYPILVEVGPREEMVTFLVTALVTGVYAIGERVWGHFAARSRLARKGMFGLFLAASIGAGGLFGGCSTIERSGDELTFELARHPTKPAPACRYRLTIDGDLVQEGEIDECPAVPACQEPER